MSSVSERPIHALRQRGIGVGVGLAAGGMFVAALLAAAPSAHADDGITNLIAAIDGTFAQGQAELSDAATFFSSGDLSEVPYGLAAGFTGLDDYSTVAQGELLQYGYDLLVGDDGPFSATSLSGLPYPTDLAATSTDVTEWLNDAHDSLLSASYDFGLNNVAAGLGDLGDAYTDYVGASQIELIGLTDTLLASL